MAAADESAEPQVSEVDTKKNDQDQQVDDVPDSENLKSAETAAKTEADKPADEIASTSIDAADEEVEPAKRKPEAPKELEVDAQEDDRPRINKNVVFDDSDATLDVLVSSEGCVITSLSQGGFQYLLSGIRSNVGVKTGRYLFEVKMLEYLKGCETELRVGVTKKQSSLFLGTGSADGVCFSYDGSFFCPTPKEPNQRVKEALGKNKNFGSATVGVVLNLDATTPTANTISIFLNGVRAGDPRTIPEHLLGQALYPTLTFKNVTLQVNLGARGHLRQLPFKCNLLGNMAADDAESSNVGRPVDGRYSMVVPVGLPEQGLLDYVDHFLEENPEYTELSERKVKDWFLKSGLWVHKARPGGGSSDKPSLNFGIKDVDNRSVLSFIMANVVQFAKRNFIVPQIHLNLQQEKRAELIQKFMVPHFDVTAHVIIGEPTVKHKEWVKNQIMVDYEERKQKALEFKARKKAKEAAKAAGDSEETSAKKQKTDDSAEDDGLPPVPDVSNSTWYLPKKNKEPDVEEKLVSQTFSEYCLPADDESFKKIEFVWKVKEEAANHLSQWVADRKATMVVADLKPSSWFLEKHKGWQEVFQEMKKKQKALKPNSQDKDESVQANEEIPDITKDEDLHKSDDGGEPIYAHFKFEDWILLSWRFELHLLVHGFVNDVDDAEHTGLPTEHLEHYYKLYYKRPFHARDLNCSKFSEVVELMADTFSIDDNAKRKPLLSKFEKDAQVVAFVKLVEEARRDRLRRIEAGDESARLKLAQSKSSGKAKGKGKKGAEKSRKIDIQEEPKNKVRSKGEGKAGGKSSRVKMAFQSRTIAKRQQERRDEGGAERSFQRTDRNDSGKGKKGKSRGPPVDKDLQWRPKNVGRFTASHSDRKRPAPAAVERDSQRASGQRPGKGSSSHGEDHAQRPGKGGKGARRFSTPPPRPPTINRADHQREHGRHQERHQERNQVRSSDRFHERPSKYEERGKGGKGKTGSRPNSATPALPAPRRDEGRLSNFRDEPRASHRESRQGRDKGVGKSGGSRSDSHSNSRQFSHGSRDSFNNGDRNVGKGDRFGKNDRGKGGPSRNFDRRR